MGGSVTGERLHGGDRMSAFTSFEPMMCSHSGPPSRSKTREKPKNGQHLRSAMIITIAWVIHSSLFGNLRV